MADRMHDQSSPSRPRSQTAFGGGFSDEGRGAYREGSRGSREQPAERFYASSDFDREDSWRPTLDTGTLSTLAIGAGLGFFGAMLLSGSRHFTAQNSVGSPDRGWSGRASRGSSSVEADESFDLIASNKVEGTAVYNRQGTKLGEVYNFMVGKRSGRVAYAVMTFGGLLGIGSSHYPLPWNVLDYDTEKGGYVVDLDKNRLSNAPSHPAHQNGFEDPGYGQRITDYWSGFSAGLT